MPGRRLAPVNEDDLKPVGRFLRNVLEDRGISVYALAEETGIPYPTLRRAVRPDADFSPSNRRLAIIADALDLNPDELYALAGRIDDEIVRAINKNPAKNAELVRQVLGISKQNATPKKTNAARNNGQKED